MIEIRPQGFVVIYVSVCKACGLFCLVGLVFESNSFQFRIWPGSHVLAKDFISLPSDPRSPKGCEFCSASV